MFIIIFVLRENGFLSKCLLFFSIAGARVAFPSSVDRPPTRQSTCHRDPILANHSFQTEEG